MSGRKSSRFTFHENVLRENEIKRTRQTVVRTCEQIRKQLAAIPSIVEERLQTVKASVEQWLFEAERATRPSISRIATSTDVSSWQSLAQKGQEMLQRLSKNVLLEHDRCQSEISTILEECASNIDSHSVLFERWLNPNAVPDFTKRLEGAQQLLRGGNLLRALRDSEAIRQELGEAIASAKARDDQHVRSTLLSEVHQLIREVKNCSFALIRTCATTKEIFENEMVECERWIQENSRLASLTLPDDESNQTLLRLAEQCRGVLENGLQLLKDSRHRFQEQLSACRSEFGCRLQKLLSQWSGEEEGMEHWLSKEEREKAKALFAEWQTRINENQFTGIERVASESEKTVTEYLNRITNLKEGHQSRIDVLKALRQVCANLGFGEVSPPQLLVEGDYTSRIAFVVDTFNQGEITFYLALDSIEANACIGKAECHFEFGKVSDQLRKHFGIHTKFETADIPTPRVIAKDEAEEPTGSGETASA